MNDAGTPVDVLYDEEGTASSFHRIGQTIARYGLFSLFYTDWGSHFHTPMAGGKADKASLPLQELKQAAGCVPPGCCTLAHKADNSCAVKPGISI